MKSIQFLMALSLLLGFPLLQVDRVIDTDWLVCEDSLAVKLEGPSFSVDKNFAFYPDPLLPLFDQISFISQLRNPLSILYASFRGIVPFWKPPPSLLFPLFERTEQREVF